MMRRFALIALLSLSATQCGSAESKLRASSPSTNYATSHQHRDLGVTDWWYIVLNALNVGCPHDSTDDHPTGHCAHPSHTPHVHHSSGSGGSGGGSSSSSNGGSSSSGCSDDSDDDCWDDDGHTDDQGDDGHDDAQWTADGHTDDASDTWGDDGHTDDDNVSEDDGSTEEATDEWEGDGNSYSYAKSSVNYSKTHSGSGGGSNGAKWAVGAGVLGLVGAAAFVATKKRKRSDDDQVNNVPENVYVQEAGDDAAPLGSYHEPSGNGGNECMNNEPSNIEMQSVKTSVTRTRSIKSALSRGGLSLKNKFSRRNAKNAGDGDVGGYLAPAEESGAAFDHDSISSNEQQMQQGGGGVTM
eukprot:CAMPEP_0181089720 /NCGR_PEP_ID=MMETSP1071-20121207/7453_1 /TAXON_ID=35127 /ORGANISM="Thalassiosira sp., Strain NH16" /LENGTH=354 /DNA_ID=CAMNT_0023171687 /DNA_START=1280 /DNA_END=2344 /DNA_ORIENTATION=+